MTDRTRLVSAIGSMAASQLSVAIGAFVRIPLTVDVIGVDQYGLVVFVNALVPLLLIPLSALRLTSRTLLAESDGAGVGRGEARRAVHRLGWRVAVVIGILGLLVLVLPVRDWMPTTSGVPPETTQTILGLTGVACAVATLGGVGWGEFEASRRVAVFHVHVVVITALGTGSAIVLNVLNAGFVLWAALAISTSVLPFITVGLHAHRVLIERWNGAGSSEAQGIKYPALVRRTTGGFLARSGSDAIVRGFDPMLVAVFVGSGAAAQLSVAQRLAQATLMVLAALTPLVAVRTAHRRGASVASVAR